MRTPGKGEAQREIPLPGLAHRVSSPLRARAFDVMVKYGESHVRLVVQGRIGPIAWSGVSWNVKFFEALGRWDLQDQEHTSPASGPKHRNMLSSTLRMTPCWQPTQTPIKSTFPTNCIHIFAIWCVLIFSEGLLVELFNCHLCKGQQVIFSTDPLLLRNSNPGQSCNFISEHSWMIILSKSGHYCRMNGSTMRTKRTLDLLYLKIIYQQEWSNNGEESGRKRNKDKDIFYVPTLRQRWDGQCPHYLEQN